MAATNDPPKTSEQKTAAPKGKSLPAITFYVYFAARDAIETMTQDGLGKIEEVDFHVCNSQEECEEKREEIIRERAQKEARNTRAKAKVARDRAKFDRDHPELSRKNAQRAEEARLEAEKSVRAALDEKKARERKRGEGPPAA